MTNLQTTTGIKAGELRFGNLLKDSWGEIRPVLGVRSDGISMSEKGVELQWKFIKDCSPIPLTPEILERTGFKNNGNISLLWKNYSFQYQYESLWLLDNEGIIQSQPIKYVHQLQNLIFALTGEELEMKFNYLVS